MIRRLKRQEDLDIAKIDSTEDPDKIAKIDGTEERDTIAKIADAKDRDDMGEMQYMIKKHKNMKTNQMMHMNDYGHSSGMMLAHSYVPWQFYNEAFGPCEALAKGTLFPELFGPYKPPT